MDGYPLVVVFGRGFFCPRDQEQMRQLVGCQSELAVTYGKLVTVSADPPMVQAAFRAGLGAGWSFEQREVIKRTNILDETEGEYAYVTRPYTFVLRPDLTIRIDLRWLVLRRNRPRTNDGSRDLPPALLRSEEPGWGEEGALHPGTIPGMAAIVRGAIGQNRSLDRVKRRTPEGVE